MANLQDVKGQPPRWEDAHAIDPMQGVRSVRAGFVIGLLSLGICAPAFGQDGFSLSAEGGYVLGGAPQGYTLLPDSFPFVVDADSKAGASGVIGLQYNWNGQFLRFRTEHVDVDTGQFYNGFGSNQGEIGIRSTIIDVEYGRALNWGGTDAYWTAGLRHADMDFEVDVGAAGFGPIHEFSGTGLRLGLETVTPLQAPGWSFATTSGLSVLDGEVSTSARTDFWDCSQCPELSRTAIGVDAKLGLSYAQSDRLRWDFGYKAQYWRDVNVEYGAENGFGLNGGSSDLLTHGPYLGLTMTFN